MLVRALQLFVASSLIVTLWAPIGASEDTPKVSVKDEKVTKAEVVTRASSGGTSVLNLIASARAAIASTDYAKATGDAAKAQSQLQELRQLNPSASLQDGIRSVQSKLESDGADAAYSDLVPIYENLTVVDDYEDATAKVKIKSEKPKYVGASRTKRYLTNAERFLKIKDVEKARVELQSAYETAVYTEVDLPVASSYVEVTTALDALQDGAKEGYDKGYAKVADEQLAAAQSSAQIIVQVAGSGAVGMDVATEPK